MAAKIVKVEDAVGMVLVHDLTKIVPGEYKGPAFRKGHVVRAEDIPHLKSIGKDHIYSLELTENEVHENEAAERLARAAAGLNINLTSPKEGRVNLTAAIDGLLVVDDEAVIRVNEIENIVVSTLHNGRLVKAGDMVAGAKVVPLVVDKTLIEQVEDQISGIIAVRPLKKLKVAAIVTGNEVYYGRITDKFGAVIKQKIAEYGASPLELVYQPDNAVKIKETIERLMAAGAEAIVVTGGMSVDPDDVTPEAIRLTGANVITYGTPVLPGAMLMLAYLNVTPIMGLPACGMYSKITVFDLVFPRLLAGIPLTKRDFAKMAHGGLCLGCKVCSYPHCPFGK